MNFGIYYALKRELDEFFPDTPFVVYDNPDFARILQGVSTNQWNPQDDTSDDICLVMWKAVTKEQLLSGEVQINPGFKHLLIEGKTSEETEWMVRFFRKRYGYTKHPEMSERIAELMWGCRVLSRGEIPKVPLVSIVIPTCETERYIEDSLISALSQTHFDLELIVVDDCSSDKTFEIAQGVLTQDEREHLSIGLTSRVGAAKARQIGVDASVGEFIMFLDSDDIIPCDYVSTALQAIGGCDVAYPRQWWLIPEGSWDKDFARVQHSTKPTLYHDKDLGHKATVDIVGDSLLMQVSSEFQNISRGSMMIINSLVRASAAPRFSQELPKLQDWDMYLDLLERGKTATSFFCPPSIRWRSSGITGSTTGTDTAKAKAFIASKHESVTKVPRTLFLPINARGNLEWELIGANVRGIDISHHIIGADIGGLPELQEYWRQYEAFVFVGKPTPASIGWMNYLVGQGRVVICDICVEYWSRDYRQDFDPYLMTLIDPDVYFITASDNLADSLKELLCRQVVITTLWDAVSPSLLVKTNYDLTYKWSWSGYYPNMVSLLAHTRDLAKLCDQFGCTVSMVSDQQPMRIPFPWKWYPYSKGEEPKLLIDSDLYLYSSLDLSSYRTKSSGRFIRAASLKVPVVDMGSHTWIEEIQFLMQDQAARESKASSDFFHVLKCDAVTIRAQQYSELIRRLIDAREQTHSTPIDDTL